MCYACLSNPFDYNDVFRHRNRTKAENNAKEEMVLIKEALRRIEISGITCGSGKDIVEALKERQYELSRVL